MPSWLGVALSAKGLLECPITATEEHALRGEPGGRAIGYALLLMGRFPAPFGAVCAVCP